MKSCEKNVKKWRSYKATLYSGALLLLILLVPYGVFTKDLVKPKIALKLISFGFEKPVHLTHAPDGSGRLFVVEQPGRISIIKDGMLVGEPFLDITDRVGCCGERGLLSVAFPPEFPKKKYFYVNYTNRSGITVISRFHLSGASPNVAVSSNEDVILAVHQPHANHNGGQIAFGRDGYLYIGMGDGGGSGDPYNNAQNPDSLLGKMLRLDVESDDLPYGIPPDNPFREKEKYRREIWALGLRNPWRFSFDRKTGDLYIADVGQNKYEEVNFQSISSRGGENYGWRISEGLHQFIKSSIDPAELTLPAVEYDHTQGCSVTGGFVYRGAAYPSLFGRYFYADYCSGKIWSMKRNWETTLMLDTDFSISSFGEDEAGNLYVLDYSNGKVYQITAD